MKRELHHVYEKKCYGRVDNSDQWIVANLFPQYPNMKTDCLNWTTINIGKEIIRFCAKRGDIESNFPGSRNLSASWSNFGRNLEVKL